MKTLKLFAFLFFVIPLSSFAQTPKAIGDDLLKLFKKIDYWSQKQGDTAIKAYDLTVKANVAFGKKLQYYTAKYPFTIGEKFAALKKENLGIVTSPDGLLRIYSWDNNTGGTMRFFINVIQYRSGPKVNSVLKIDTSNNNDNYIYYYSKLYTLNAGGKIYYLAVYNGTFSSKDRGEGIRIFAIKNGKLDENVNLFKTPKGLQHKIYYDYDLSSIIYWKIKPSIYFDKASKTIFIPVVDGDGKVSHSYLAYKFTGKYFEEVKNH